MSVAASVVATHTGRTLPTLVPVGLAGEIQVPLDSYSVAYSKSTHHETAVDPMSVAFQTSSFPDVEMNRCVRFNETQCVPLSAETQ